MRPRSKPCPLLPQAKVSTNGFLELSFPGQHQGASSLKASNYSIQAVGSVPLCETFF